MFLFVAFAPAAEPSKFEVEVQKDVAYHTGKDADKERHTLDVYTPKGKKDFPVLFFVHGGAWRQGNKRVFAEPAKRFAEAGVGVVSTNYRLTPAVKHPAHIEDVAKAFAWTVDNIGKHGGDAKKVVVSGHSAGGHLAALLATNEAYLKAEKKSLADVRGVFAISGVYVVSPAVQMFRPIFGDDESVYKGASPLANVGASHPPMLLVYADKDLSMLDKGAEVFAATLTKGKQTATTKEFAGRDHMSILSGMKGADDPVFLAAKEFVEKCTTK
jgi:acetyl esterase/lipase